MYEEIYKMDKAQYPKLQICYKIEDWFEIIREKRDKYK